MLLNLGVSPTLDLWAIIVENIERKSKKSTNFSFIVAAGFKSKYKDFGY